MNKNLIIIINFLKKLIKKIQILIYKLQKVYFAIRATKTKNLLKKNKDKKKF